MRTDSCLEAPRVEVRSAAGSRPATPLRLEGHEATLLMDPWPEAVGAVSLRLGWSDGSETELRAVSSGREADGRVARFAVHAVRGDWQPFLAWVGGTLAGDSAR